MRLYLELARRGYRRYAAYPAATAAGVFTNTIFGFMQAYILLALFRHREEIGGYDASDTVTYVWLTQALLAPLAIFGWNELALRIRSGDIATDLSRPLDVQVGGLAFDFGRALYHALFRGLPPLAVGALVFGLTTPVSVAGWLAFAACFALAVAISYAFRFLYNLPAFWLLHFRGPALIALLLAWFFSGLFIPVRFFPDWLENAAYATPFPMMLQTPVDVFVGAVAGTELLLILGAQVAWLAVLLAAGRLVFAVGVRRVVIQGG